VMNFSRADGLLGKVKTPKLGTLLLKIEMCAVMNFSRADGLGRKVETNKTKKEKLGTLTIEVCK
jgi:hypothetical protein